MSAAGVEVDAVDMRAVGEEEQKEQQQQQQQPEQDVDQNAQEGAQEQSGEYFASPTTQAVTEHNSEEGKATLTETVVNMATNIMGGGCLGMSSAFAHDSPLLGIFLFLSTVCLALLNLFFIGEASQETGCFDYQELVRRAFGPRLAPAALVMLVLFPFGALVAYAAIMSHICPSLAQELLGYEKDTFFTSGVTWIGITSIVFFALSARRFLAELFWSSVVGALTIMIVVLFVVIRWIDGSYAPGGAFYDPKSYNTTSSANGDDVKQFYVSSSLFASFPIFLFSLSVHNNFPQYMMQMRVDRKSLPHLVEHKKDREGDEGNPAQQPEQLPLPQQPPQQKEPDSSQTQRQQVELTYNRQRKLLAYKAVKIVFSAGVIPTYILIGVAGYETFGRRRLETEVDGDIINAYHPDDGLMVFARILLFLHFLTVFPLLCHASRRYAWDLFGLHEVGFKTLLLHTGIMVALSALLAIVLGGSLDVILGINGAVAGTCIVTVIPSTIFLRLVPSAEEYTPRRILAFASIVCGVVVGVISLVTVVTSSSS